MEIDLNKTLRALVCCLPEDSEPNVEALTKMSGGRLEAGCVVLTFEESLPSMKEYSAALDEHWRAMIHAAIQEAAVQEGLPRFDRAFVQIEVTTPRGQPRYQ